MDTWVTQLPHPLHRGAHSQSMQVKSSSLCEMAPKGNPQSALVQEVGERKSKGLQASQNTVLQDPGRLPPHFQLNTLRSWRP